MATIKITSKRQATLPVDLCRELDLRPGDEIRVEKKLLNGRRVWTLEPANPSLSWFGSLSKYAESKSHEMKDIRRSIGRGLAKDKGL